jgi:hypothetical protein
MMLGNGEHDLFRFVNPFLFHLQPVSFLCFFFAPARYSLHPLRTAQYRLPSKSSAAVCSLFAGSDAALLQPAELAGAWRRRCECTFGRWWQVAIRRVSHHAIVTWHIPPITMPCRHRLPCTAPSAGRNHCLYTL